MSILKFFLSFVYTSMYIKQCFNYNLYVLSLCRRIYNFVQPKLYKLCRKIHILSIMLSSMASPWEIWNISCSITIFQAGRRFTSVARGKIIWARYSLTFITLMRCVPRGVRAHRMMYAQPGECLVANQAPSLVIDRPIALTIIYRNDKYLKERKL